jgi:hypothetical protein
MSGFYKMHRGWQDNPVFAREEFSRRDAWVWLIENAAFKDTSVGIGPKRVDVRRGQLCHSLRFMAKAWGWDDPKVRRFLSRLSSERMTECVVVAGQTLVTICNYDDYQNSERVADAEPDAGTTQERRTNDAKKKEDKEVKKEEPNGSSGAAGARAKRGTRLPADWEPSADGRALVAELGLELTRTVAEFRDYWTALPGAKGVKLDWDATFRNRCRDIADRRPMPRGSPPPRGDGLMPRPPDDQHERRMKLWHDKGIWAEGWGPKPATRAA